MCILFSHHMSKILSQGESTSCIIRRHASFRKVQFSKKNWTNAYISYINIDLTHSITHKIYLHLDVFQVCSIGRLLLISLAFFLLKSDQSNDAALFFRDKLRFSEIPLEETGLCKSCFLCQPIPWL